MDAPAGRVEALAAFLDGVGEAGTVLRGRGRDIIGWFRVFGGYFHALDKVGSVEILYIT